MAHKFAFAAEAELACPVCFQYYVSPHEPKNLPKCAHIFCRLCLKKMTEGGLKKIKCPQCNKQALLPADGVDGLTTILALRNLAEKHPEGIKQRKEHMQTDLHKEKEDKAMIVDELKELEKQTQSDIKHEKLEIERSVEVVMIQAQELINQITNTCKPKLTQIQQQRYHFEAQIKKIEATLTKLETMPDDEFLTQTEYITNQIEKLQIDHLAQISSDHQVGRFIANAQLGRIVKPRRLELVQEFGEFKGAWGIASKSTGVIAVSDVRVQPPKVIVFQNVNGQYSKRFQFDVNYAKKDALVDVAIAPDDRYLIAKPEAGFDIYSPDGKCQKSISTLTQNQGKEKEEVTFSIASTADGRTIAGSGFRAEGDKSPEFVVTVHDPAGNILKTIPISITPHRIADIRGTHVAVSDGEHKKVCMYDLLSGKETLSFDLPMSFGIYFDEQSDCMLIGRMSEKDEDGNASGVIEQYCSITGKLVTCLARGLQWPASMTLTHDSMLAVTNGKTVKLYQIS